MPQKPAIFLDRDNTLIRDDGYIFEIEKFTWITGAVAALKRVPPGRVAGIYRDQSRRHWTRHLYRKRYA